jgi:hypothetical protein
MIWHSLTPEYLPQQSMVRVPTILKCFHPLVAPGGGKRNNRESLRSYVHFSIGIHSFFISWGKLVTKIFACSLNGIHFILEQGWRTYGTWKISLARGIHCCPSFLFLLPDQPLYTVKNVCICMYVYLTAYRLNINYRSYQITLRVKPFYANREWCEVLAGYSSLERRPGGELVNTRHWPKYFTVLFSNRKQ